MAKRVNRDDRRGTPAPLAISDALSRRELRDAKADAAANFAAGVAGLVIAIKPFPISFSLSLSLALVWFDWISAMPGRGIEITNVINRERD